MNQAVDLLDAGAEEDIRALGIRPRSLQKAQRNREALPATQMIISVGVLHSRATTFEQFVSDICHDSVTIVSLFCYFAVAQ
jgi:hypothetical protein